MKYSKQIIYLCLILAFLWACWFSFTIYTSLMSKHLPWYEPCGMQFLVILVFSCPVMFGIGIAYIILGRFMPIGKPTKILPFVTGTAITSLVFIDDSLGLGMQVAGAACCVLAAISMICLAIKDLAFRKKIDHT
ncbi:hypothetical protein ACFLS1_05480 [Verrucomicrobiota bacterium]